MDISYKEYTFTLLENEIQTKHLEIMKHTKGEWKIGASKPWYYESAKTCSGSFEIWSGTTKIVDVTAYGFWNLAYEEAEANAKLIAAAPELLGVLLDEIEFLDSLLSDKLDGKYRITDTATRSTMNSRIVVLKQAIKKVTE